MKTKVPIRRIPARDLREWLESAKYFAAPGMGRGLSRGAHGLMAERLVVVIEEVLGQRARERAGKRN